MAFRVRQKVVCISVAMYGGVPNPSGNYPTIGSVYTIRGIFPYKSRSCLQFEELDNSHLPRWRGIESGFCSSRFRPVVSTDTGMTVLEQIRRDVTNKELRPIFEDEQV